MLRAPAPTTPRVALTEFLPVLMTSLRAMSGMGVPLIFESAGEDQRVVVDDLWSAAVVPSRGGGLLPSRIFSRM